MGKKMKVLPRNITEEDAKDLKSKSYTSDFDFELLVDIGIKARKLHKEEAKKLMIFHSKEEEEEEFFISKKQNKQLLIKKAYVEEGKENYYISPELSAKRKRTSMRENSVYVPTGIDIPKRERLMREKRFKKPAVAIQENPKRDSVNKRKRKNGVNGNNSSDDHTPDMPEDMVNMILRDLNGSGVKLLIQKQLTETDLNKGQNRISMPFNQLNRSEEDFLTQKEENHLMGKIDGIKNGIDVLFIEPNGDPNWELVFKRWDMEKNNGGNVSSMYVLNGKWKDVCRKHGLDKHTIVQIWSFRYNDGELGLAMVIVRRVANRNANTNMNNENRNGNGNGSRSDGKGSGHGSSESGNGSETTGYHSGDWA